MGQGNKGLQNWVGGGIVTTSICIFERVNGSTSLTIQSKVEGLVKWTIG